jgi:hypothetical protein
VIFVKRDGVTVVFSTIKGRLKTRNMARDPRVSLLVVDKRQPAAAAYHRDEDGVLRAFGIAVLDVTAAGIARIVVFGEPGLVTLFGLPLVTSPLDAAGNSRPG